MTAEAQEPQAKGRTVQLAGPTRDRLTKLMAQVQALQKSMSMTVTIALEAMGEQGVAQSYDAATGLVTLMPTPTPLNRAERRKGKGHASPTA